MTTQIQTFHVQGFGGSAEIRGPRVIADYQPGAFELAELAVCTFASLVAMFGVAAGMWVARDSAGLGLVCDVAGLLALVAGFGAWRSAVHSLRTRGERRIQLVRGWVEMGREIRHLRDARPVLEELRIGRFSLARLVLRFPDGTRVPVVQGPRARVAPFLHAVGTAPARRPTIERAARAA